METPQLLNLFPISVCPRARCPYHPAARLPALLDLLSPLCNLEAAAVAEVAAAAVAAYFLPHQKRLPLQKGRLQAMSSTMPPPPKDLSATPLPTVRQKDPLTRSPDNQTVVKEEKEEEEEEGEEAAAALESRSCQSCNEGLFTLILFFLTTKTNGA